MVEVITAYATHFIDSDMYVDKHTGRHMRGDRVRMLLLTLVEFVNDVKFVILSMMLLHLLVLDRLCTGWHQSKIPVTRLSALPPE